MDGGTVWQTLHTTDDGKHRPTEGRTMAQYSTHKNGTDARRETIARRQARAVKRGTTVTRGGRTVVRKDGGR